MEYLELHQEPPNNLSTLVIALAGWIDAGEAATGALRYMVRRLPATRLASVDPEEFFDFTQVRPLIRTMPDGSRTIRWPGNEFFYWQRPEGGTGLLLLRGTEPSLKWSAFTTMILDLAERCGVRRIVSLGALLAALPHTRPPRVTGTSTDPDWQAKLEEWGILRQRRPSYQGPTSISTALSEAAATRGIPYLSFMGQAPHYIQAAPNPLVTRAILNYVCRLLGIRLNLSRLDEMAGAFRARCDETIAQEGSIEAYVRQLEQQYDEAINPQVPDTEEFDAESLMLELETFLRQQREDEGPT